MTNQMGASGFCDCGGKFEHVDDEPGSNPDTTDSSYFCDGCKTWCVVTWDNLTEREFKREYEGEDTDLFWGQDGHLYRRFYDDNFEDSCGAPGWADNVYRASEEVTR